MAIDRGYSEGEINQAIKLHVPKWRKEGLMKKKLSVNRHVRFVRRLAELSAQKRKSNVITE